MFFFFVWNAKNIFQVGLMEMILCRIHFAHFFFTGCLVCAPFYICKEGVFVILSGCFISTCYSFLRCPQKADKEVIGGGSVGVGRCDVAC